MSKRSRKVAFEEEVVEYADKRRRNEEERWQEGERSKWALFAQASFPAPPKSGRPRVLAVFPGHSMGEENHFSSLGRNDTRMWPMTSSPKHVAMVTNIQL